MKQCKYCGSKIPDADDTCSHCGSIEFYSVCANCGETFDGEFCKKCGIRAGSAPSVCPICGTRYFTNVCPVCSNARVMHDIPSAPAPARAIRQKGSNAAYFVAFFLPFVGLWFIGFGKRFGKLTKLLYAGWGTFITIWAFSDILEHQRYSDILGLILMMVLPTIACLIMGLRTEQRRG